MKYLPGQKQGSKVTTMLITGNLVISWGLAPELIAKLPLMQRFQDLEKLSRSMAISKNKQ